MYKESNVQRLYSIMYSQERKEKEEEELKGRNQKLNPQKARKMPDMERARKEKQKQRD